MHLDDWLTRACDHPVIVIHGAHVDNLRVTWDCLQDIKRKVPAVSIVIHSMCHRHHVYALISADDEAVRLIVVVIDWILSSPADVVDVVWRL